MSGKQHQTNVTRICLGLTLLLAAFDAANAQQPEPQELDEYRLYSQPQGSSHLVRYGFADNAQETVGPVTLQSGTVVSGIDALAHVPRNTNLFAFWNDPSDQLTKLVYVNSHDATAVIVGHDMGSGRITGAVAVKPYAGDDLASNLPTTIDEVQQHELYGVQKTNAVQFEVTNQRVVPLEPFAAKVTVLGTAISYGGEYDMPVTAQFMIGGSVVEPFGNLTNAVDGNVNDGNNPRSYIFDEIHSAATPINIIARSWKKKKNTSGNSSHDWQMYINVSSNQSNGGVITLRNGDDVPDITPFLDQSSIVDFIPDDYIVSGKINLQPNQAIYLYELGTNNFSSSAADYQDLVILVTLAKTPEELINAESLPVAHLIAIDSKTGDTETIMPLEHAYDSLTAMTSDMFYATSNNNLYQIDPQAQTETLIDASDEVHIGELGASHSTLWGFGDFNNNTTLFDLSQGYMQDIPSGLNHQNLDPIVLVRVADMPLAELSFD